MINFEFENVPLDHFGTLALVNDLINDASLVQ